MQTVILIPKHPGSHPKYAEELRLGDQIAQRYGVSLSVVGEGDLSLLDCREQVLVGHRIPLRFASLAREAWEIQPNGDLECFTVSAARRA